MLRWTPQAAVRTRQIQVAIEAADIALHDPEFVRDLLGVPAALQRLVASMAISRNGRLIRTGLAEHFEAEQTARSQSQSSVSDVGFKPRTLEDFA
jgi:hypothetical protein